MLSRLKFAVVASLLIVSGCNKAKSQCADRLMVLEGNGPTQLESQWDACVAKNASRISVNRVSNERLAKIALELCSDFDSRYAGALRIGPPELPSEQVDNLLVYKRENLSRIAISEIYRARKLGCEAK